MVATAVLSVATCLQRSLLHDMWDTSECRRFLQLDDIMECFFHLACHQPPFIALNIIHMGNITSMMLSHVLPVTSGA